MRIVVASDSFKGSLTSTEIVEVVTAVSADLMPGSEVIGVPMADGGEGTVVALAKATGGEVRRDVVTGPSGLPVCATWGLLPDGTAIVEMAAASGLPLVPESLRNPRHTTTYGTGELMLCALDAGARELLLAIGGSATNDGGMGALSALGISFRDVEGHALNGVGDSLSRVAQVDVSALDRRLADGAVRVHVMCDVDNPLLGPQGATSVFSPQKGADQATVSLLEEGMASYAYVVSQTLGIDLEAHSSRPGAGAAGGLGFALEVFLGAEMVSGVEAVLDAVAFDDVIAGADLVITGEGRLDAQTEHGKVVAGVARRCQGAGVPCVAIAGSIERGVSIDELGLYDARATAPEGMPLPEAMAHARELYAVAVRRVLGWWA